MYSAALLLALLSCVSAGVGSGERTAADRLSDEIAEHLDNADRAPSSGVDTRFRDSLALLARARAEIADLQNENRALRQERSELRNMVVGLQEELRASERDAGRYYGLRAGFIAILALLAAVLVTWLMWQARGLLRKLLGL